MLATNTRFLGNSTADGRVEVNTFRFHNGQTTSYWFAEDLLEACWRHAIDLLPAHGLVYSLSTAVLQHAEDMQLWTNCWQLFYHLFFKIATHENKMASMLLDEGDRIIILASCGIICSENAKDFPLTFSPPKAVLIMVTGTAMVLVKLPSLNSKWNMIQA